MSVFKTNVIAKLELEGLHNWPAAQGVFPEVGFLSSMHRHKWYITAKKRVHHDDRDVEFIMFKRDILEYLGNEYYNADSRTHEFAITFVLNTLILPIYKIYFTNPNDS
jgi:hypothetical protein